MKGNQSAWKEFYLVSVGSLCSDTERILLVASRRYCRQLQRQSQPSSVKRLSDLERDCRLYALTQRPFPMPTSCP